MNRIIKFLNEEDGPTSVEYAVMLAMILGVLVVSLKTMGAAAGGMWSNNSAELINHGF